MLALLHWKRMTNTRLIISGCSNSITSFRYLLYVHIHPCLPMFTPSIHWGTFHMTPMEFRAIFEASGLSWPMVVSYTCREFVRLRETKERAIWSVSWYPLIIRKGLLAIEHMAISFVDLAMKHGDFPQQTVDQRDPVFHMDQANGVSVAALRRSQLWLGRQTRMSLESALSTASRMGRSRTPSPQNEWLGGSK